MLHELQKVVNLIFFFIFFVFFLVTRIMCIEMLHLFQKVPIYLHNPKKNSLFFNNYQVSLFFLFFCLKKMNLKKQQNIHTKYKQYYYTFLHKVLYKRIISIQIVCVRIVNGARCQMKLRDTVTEMVGTGRIIAIALEATRGAY